MLGELAGVEAACAVFSPDCVAVKFGELAAVAAALELANLAALALEEPAEVFEPCLELADVAAVLEEQLTDLDAAVLEDKLADVAAVLEELADVLESCRELGGILQR